MFLSCFEEHNLVKLSACIVADTKVAGLCGHYADTCIAACARCTTAQYSAEELACLIVAVTDAPTLFNELRQSCKPQTLQSIEVYIIAFDNAFNILAFSVIGRYELLPKFQTLLYKEILRTLRRERYHVYTVHVGLC